MFFFSFFLIFLPLDSSDDDDELSDEDEFNITNRSMWGTTGKGDQALTLVDQLRKQVQDLQDKLAKNGNP